MKIIGLLLGGMLFAGPVCAQDGFTIQGEVEGIREGEIFLLDAERNSADTLVKGVIREGKFRMEGKRKGVIAASVRIKDVANGPVLFLENADFKIHLSTSRASAYEDGKLVQMMFLGNELQSAVTGGKEQTIANLFWKALGDLVEFRDKISAQYEQAGQKGDVAEQKKLEFELGEVLKNYLSRDDSLLRKYADSYAAAYLVAEFMDDVYEGDMIGHKYTLLGEKARRTFWGQCVARRLQELARIKPGQKAPDFTLTGVKGEKISLSQVTAKIKLLDFWSPGCGPCLQAMPELVQVYQEFHKQGLEVISICMGADPAMLVRLREEYHMPWICAGQFQKSDSDIGSLYGIAAWPTLILTDADNNIISTTPLTTLALRDKLKELLLNK